MASYRVPNYCACCLWDYLHAQEVKMATLKSEKVIQQWGQLIEGGAGRDRWVLDTTEQLIKDANIPNVSLRREAVSSGLFGEKRDFLIVTHRALREYEMFISAREYGRHLAVSWYLTVNPSFLKRSISKRITGNPNALSQEIPVFAQQDLNAYVGIAGDCAEKACETLMDELKLDTSTIDRKSKGVLNIW
jgi:hypothetical protein